MTKINSNYSNLFHSIVAPGGIAMVAGGLSVLATEFPAAQRVLDVGKDTLRNFAEYESDDKKALEKNEVEDMIDVEDIMKVSKESVRSLAKNQILPLIDRFIPSKENEDVETKDLKEANEILE